jgi:hypothetical protein
LCQPIDIGINKLIKTGMREKWENWMVEVEGEGVVNSTGKEPS